MDHVDLNFTINVSFGTMQKEDYDEFVSFFKAAQFQNEPMDNKKVIDFLSLDKRPMHVLNIGIKENSRHKSISHNAEIELIC